MQRGDSGLTTLFPARQSHETLLVRKHTKPVISSLQSLFAVVRNSCLRVPSRCDHMSTTTTAHSATQGTDRPRQQTRTSWTFPTDKRATQHWLSTSTTAHSVRQGADRPRQQTRKSWTFPTVQLKLLSLSQTSTRASPSWILSHFLHGHLLRCRVAESLTREQQQRIGFHIVLIVALMAARYHLVLPVRLAQYRQEAAPWNRPSRGGTFAAGRPPGAVARQQCSLQLPWSQRPHPARPARLALDA